MRECPNILYMVISRYNKRVNRFDIHEIKIAISVIKELKFTKDPITVTGYSVSDGTKCWTITGKPASQENKEICQRLLFRLLQTTIGFKE